MRSRVVEVNVFGVPTSALPLCYSQLLMFISFKLLFKKDKLKYQNNNKKNLLTELLVIINGCCLRKLKTRNVDEKL